MFSIGITTFKRRIKSLEKMVDFFKACDPEIIINIAVNGEIMDEFDDQYRKDVLALCLRHKKVYPFFYQEFRSLAKLWNNLIISSKTEFNLILNDDLVFDYKQNFVQIVNSIITNNPTINCFTINGSWSHYVMSKKTLDEMNYFDERLLLIGEEDGDFVWRYIDKYGNYPASVNLPIVANLHQTGTEDVTQVAKDTEIGRSNKPRFNQEFISNKYKLDPTSKIGGMFGAGYSKIMEDERQYPYESFYMKNKHNLNKFDKIIISELPEEQSQVQEP